MGHGILSESNLPLMQLTKNITYEGMGSRQYSE